MDDNELILEGAVKDLCNLQFFLLNQFMLDVKFKENTKGKLLKFEFLKDNSRKSSLFLFKKLN